MEWQDFFKLLHVITFVYWVGADIGVFYAARLVVNPQYTPQTRANILKILDWIDQIPRYMLLATFPVGATLAANLAISPITGFWLYAVWIVAIGWMWVITHLHKHHGKSKALAQADLRALMERGGLAPAGGTPEQLAAMMKSDVERLQRIVKVAGIVPE